MQCSAALCHQIGLTYFQSASVIGLVLCPHGTGSLAAMQCSLPHCFMAQAAADAPRFRLPRFCVRSPHGTTTSLSHLQRSLTHLAYHLLLCRHSASQGSPLMLCAASSWGCTVLPLVRIGTALLCPQPTGNSMPVCALPICHPSVCSQSTCAAIVNALCDAWHCAS